MTERVFEDVEITIDAPRQQFGAMRWVADELLIEPNERAERMLHYTLQDLQARVGVGLVDYIWRSGGVATVALEMNRQRDYARLATEFGLRANVEPALHEMHRLVVVRRELHHVVWPADWYCDHCGTLNDGLKRPRSCGGCGGPKPGRYW